MKEKATRLNFMCCDKFCADGMTQLKIQTIFLFCASSAESIFKKLVRSGKSLKIPPEKAQSEVSSSNRYEMAVS
jgi:hypothetical protein